MLRRLIFFVFASCIFIGPALSQQVSLDHVAIYVKDVQVSASFYKDVFGLAESTIPFHGISIPVRWIDLGHGVALHIVGGRKEPIERPKWDHIALACGNMEAEIVRLDSKGIA